MKKTAADDAGAKFSDLLALMATLRSDEGCPWDREQTHASLKRYIIEEAYELLEAIDSGDDDAFVEELGDVLLQIVFHAQIAAETGRFTMADVVDTLAAKLIRRHPHVFGDGRADDAEDVLNTWAEVKRQERMADAGKQKPGGAETSDDSSLLASVPRALPALMEAEQVQRRTAQVGFQWDDVAGAWEKLLEELDELQQAAEGGDDRAAVEDELGDVLFCLVNVARYLDVDPEQSLRRANAKFRRRFAYIERDARDRGRTLEDMTLEEMDALWDKAKKQGQG